MMVGFLPCSSHFPISLVENVDFGTFIRFIDQVVVAESIFKIKTLFSGTSLTFFTNEGMDLLSSSNFRQTGVRISGWDFHSIKNQDFYFVFHTVLHEATSIGSTPQNRYAQDNPT